MKKSRHVAETRPVCIGLNCDSSLACSYSIQDACFGYGSSRLGKHNNMRKIEYQNKDTQYI